MEKKMQKPEITYIELTMTDVIVTSDPYNPPMAPMSSSGADNETGYNIRIDFDKLFK